MGCIPNRSSVYTSSAYETLRRRRPSAPTPEAISATLATKVSGRTSGEPPLFGSAVAVAVAVGLAVAVAMGLAVAVAVAVGLAVAVAVAVGLAVAVAVGLAVAVAVAVGLAVIYCCAEATGANSNTSTALTLIRGRTFSCNTSFMSHVP
jgi:hypothetical protein